VDVWRIPLQAPPDRLEEYRAVLNEAEQNRLASFYFQADRLRFLVAHGVLRSILGRYLGQPPVALSFSVNAFGKPALAPAWGDPPLSFNLSHSRDLALLAVAAGRHTGVDVEYIRPELVDERIPERFFSPAEVAALRRLPPGQQKDVFFQVWTRKEAFIKAKGMGLSIPLDQFDVSVTPGEPAALLRYAPDPAETACWELVSLQPGPGYAAALAVAGGGWALKNWEWVH
jgi:4'-phosphopantetheinyl transferase